MGNEHIFKGGFVMHFYLWIITMSEYNQVDVNYFYFNTTKYVRFPHPVTLCLSGDWITLKMMIGHSLKNTPNYDWA